LRIHAGVNLAGNLGDADPEGLVRGDGWGCGCGEPGVGTGVPHWWRETCGGEGLRPSREKKRNDFLLEMACFGEF